MLLLYRLLFMPALLVLAPRYLLRMRRRGGYRENFGQRFGAVPALPERRPGVRRIWLQAVSVGEVLAVAPLIAALKADGKTEVYLTTTTSTGRKVALDRIAGQVIGIGYFPLDWAPFSSRAWNAIRPDLSILTEGERWPEHIRQAQNRGVPVVAVNARLSDRSFRRMSAFRSAVLPLLGGITRLLPGSALDEQRFKELGFPAERLATLGNIKLDVAITELAEPDRARLRSELGLGPGLVLLGSSTWPGEDAALIEVLRRSRAAGIAVSLLLVPRHPERRPEIEELLSRSGLSFHFRSSGPRPAGGGAVDVAVGDTVGELRNFTQVTDLVFVGKSLAPHTGGQTPVEPAAIGKPIVFGPGMGNFRAIAAELVTSRGAVQVSGEAELGTVVIDLLRDAGRRDALAAAARKWHSANRGAVARTADEVRRLLAPGLPAVGPAKAGS